MPDTPDPSRWQALFSTSPEPVFLLDRRRRLVLANAAWEALTGLNAGQVRGAVCRRARTPVTDPLKSIPATLAPPPTVLQGQTARVRRAVNAATSWEIEFVPLLARGELLCVLGRICSAESVAPNPLPEHLQALRRRSAQRFRLDLLPAFGPAMHRVVDQARLAAQSRAPTLLVGPPGAGKHWLARAIHHHGMTTDLTCAAVHAGRLPGGAIAEVLFGPSGLTRQAGVGSIVLSEIALLPRDVQARLRDWLRESGAARPRLIACASTPPAEDVKAGRLLDELRCAFPLEILLPPLQERPGDLPALIELLLQRAAGGLEKKMPALTPEAAAALRDHRCPGNLTELYAVLLSAARHAKHERIDLADLPAYLRQAVKLEATPGRPTPRQLPLKLLREQMERRVIGLALQMARGNKSEAARILEMERLSLLSRMKALGLE